MKRKRKLTSRLSRLPKPAPKPTPKPPNFSTTPPDRYVVFTRQQFCQCCNAAQVFSEFFAERAWENTTTKAQCFHRQRVEKPEFNVPISERVGEPESIAFCRNCAPSQIERVMKRLPLPPKPLTVPLKASRKAKTLTTLTTLTASLSDIDSL